MIVKKLAVPFINEKLLQQAQHCYIATAAITETGFDFVRSRMPLTCKIEMVTGLDGLTSPQVLRRVWRNYQDRMTLNIYTRNAFHANVYIFDLPFRKAIAFVGSGNFSLEGIKDHEEIFYKITDAKEIEALKSWFTGYFEFGMPLTENLIQEYELIYPAMKQREIASRHDKEQLVSLTASGFNWESIKFKNQFFKKEDYLVLGNTNAYQNTEALHQERLAVQQKLLQLHELVKDHLASLKFNESADSNYILRSLAPVGNNNQKLDTIGLAYGKSETELMKISPDAKALDFFTMQMMLRSKDFCIWMVSNAKAGKTQREYFKDQIADAGYKTTFFKSLTSLGAGYWIEITGDKKAVDFFQTEDALCEFIKADDWRYFEFVIGKNYSVGSVDISNENIVDTVKRTIENLLPVYRLIVSR